MGYVITNISIGERGDLDIEVNDVLLQEVPSADGQILKYVDSAGENPIAYFKRLALYKTVMQVSEKEILEKYPEAEL